MPVHRVKITDAEERVAEIEKTERIVSTEKDGAALLVFTEPVGQRRSAGGRETRLAP